VQELIVKGKFQSSVICGLTAPGFNIRVPTQIVRAPKRVFSSNRFFLLKQKGLDFSQLNNYILYLIFKKIYGRRLKT